MEWNSKTYELRDKRKLEIRCPTTADAKQMLTTYKKICSESNNLSRGPEEFSIPLKKERLYIKSMNISPRNLILLAFVDGQYIGNADIVIKSSLSRDRHRCTLGIALLNEFTGLGIGTILIEELADAAKFVGYEQMELDVVSTNTKAKRLYEKLGFKTIGVTPHGQKYLDGSYADVEHMVRFLYAV